MRVGPGYFRSLRHKLACLASCGVADIACLSTPRNQHACSVDDDADPFPVPNPNPVPRVSHSNPAAVVNSSRAPKS